MEKGELSGGIVAAHRWRWRGRKGDAGRSARVCRETWEEGDDYIEGVGLLSLELGIRERKKKKEKNEESEVWA